MTMTTCLHLFQMRSELEIEFMGYLPNARPPNHTKPAPAPWNWLKAKDPCGNYSIYSWFLSHPGGSFSKSKNESSSKNNHKNMVSQNETLLTRSIPWLFCSKSCKFILACPVDFVGCQSFLTSPFSESVQRTERPTSPWQSLACRQVFPCHGTWKTG